MDTLKKIEELLHEGRLKPKEPKGPGDPVLWDWTEEPLIGGTAPGKAGSGETSGNDHSGNKEEGLSNPLRAGDGGTLI